MLCLLLTLIGSKQASAFWGEVPFSGSAHFYAAPRFFNDSVLGSANGFDTWGWPEFGASFGVYELPFRIEPVIGFSYVFKTGNEISTAAGTSIDKFFYQFFTTEIGARWTAWEQSFFPVIPFVQAGMTYRFGRFKKRTSAVGVRTSVVGGDFGGNLTGGAIISFFYDQKRRDDMSSEWELKDFGATLFGSYQPSGLFRHGLGGVNETGGTSFGGGLYFDW